MNTLDRRDQIGDVRFPAQTLRPVQRVNRGLIEEHPRDIADAVPQRVEVVTALEDEHDPSVAQPLRHPNHFAREV